MELDTISDQQKTKIQRQIAVFVLAGLALAVFAYFALAIGFGRASPEFIAQMQGYLVNSPDFTKCHPLFSARVVAHYLFVEASFLFILVNFSANLLVRLKNGKINKRNLKNYTGLFVALLLLSLPLISGDYLPAGRRFHIMHFEDFCINSWNLQGSSYAVLYFYLYLHLIAIGSCIGALVYALHNKSVDALSDDLHIAAEQLCVRLEMGTIDQATFDATARKLGLMK